MSESVSVSIPSLPELKLGDLPSAFTDTEERLQLYLHQLDGLSDVSWVLANTFYELEAETIDFMRSRVRIPFRSIGPSIPSAFLDRRNPDDVRVGADPWKSMDSVHEWLDKKPPSSVVYISFGSVTVINPWQIYELALGIQSSGHNFLWVIRPPPGHDDMAEFFPAGFVEETEGRGLVVDWCVQLEVLSHPSVAAFMSHCGWNSTLEALSLGVPVLTMGVWNNQTTNSKFLEHVWKAGVRIGKGEDGMYIHRLARPYVLRTATELREVPCLPSERWHADQTTNSKFLADVWRAGVRMGKGENGTVGRGEIERCIRLAVDQRTEAGEEVRKHALKWKKLAKTAMSEGGSSDINLNEFVQEVVAISTQSFPPPPV